jgi:uncharacterized membrane protein
MEPMPEKRGLPPAKEVERRLLQDENCAHKQTRRRRHEGDTAMNEAISDRQAVDTNMAKVIYVLYLIGIVAGVTAIVGVVMAYVYRDNAPDWLRTHYDFQIRTFWMVVLYCIIAGILTLVLIGFAMFLAIAIWWIVRCVKGLKYLEQRQAYPNHQTWAF